jgi:hypothetical protein
MNIQWTRQDNPDDEDADECQPNWDGTVNGELVGTIVLSTLKEPGFEYAGHMWTSHHPPTEIFPYHTDLELLMSKMDRIYTALEAVEEA